MRSKLKLGKIAETVRTFRLLGAQSVRNDPRFTVSPSSCFSCISLHPPPVNDPASMSQDPTSVTPPTALKLYAWSELEEALKEVKLHFSKSSTLIKRRRGFHQLLEHAWNNLCERSKQRIGGYLFEVFEEWRETDMGARELMQLLVSIDYSPPLRIQRKAYLQTIFTSLQSLKSSRCS